MSRALIPEMVLHGFVSYDVAAKDAQPILRCHWKCFEAHHARRARKKGGARPGRCPLGPCSQGSPVLVRDALSLGSTRIQGLLTFAYRQ